MLHTLRTYRALPMLLAAALLCSVSLPLVQYTCEMSGATMPVLAASGSGTVNHAAHGMTCCHGVPSRVLDVLCAHMGCCRSEAAREAVSPPSGKMPESIAVSETSCSGCISETVLEEQALLSHAKPILGASLLPTVAVLTSALDDAPRSFALPRTPGAEWPPGPSLPLRVLFSSFLL